MKKDIVLISGALATPKLWQHQEKFMQDTMNIHYLDMQQCHSIPEMARCYAQKGNKAQAMQDIQKGQSLGAKVDAALVQLIK